MTKGVIYWEQGPLRKRREDDGKAERKAGSRMTKTTVHQGRLKVELIIISDGIICLRAAGKASLQDGWDAQTKNGLENNMGADINVARAPIRRSGFAE